MKRFIRSSSSQESALQESHEARRFYTGSVIFDRGETVGRSRHVGYAPESGSKIRVLASTAMGLCELMASPGT
jgi:hypothetical protein